jgi:hypothetical protein
MILLASPLVYFYGVYWLIPDIFEDSSGPVQTLNYAFGTWCLLAIFANLILARYRHSSIRARFLKPPIIIAQPESFEPEELKGDSDLSCISALVPHEVKSGKMN